MLGDPGDLTIADIQEFIALSSEREQRERKEREDALLLLRRPVGRAGAASDSDGPKEAPTTDEWSDADKEVFRSINACQMYRANLLLADRWACDNSIAMWPKRFAKPNQPFVIFTSLQSFPTRLQRVLLMPLPPRYCAQHWP